jgi:hypothetical protein
MIEKTKFFIRDKDFYRDVLSSVSSKWYNTRYIIAKLVVVSDEKVVVSWNKE